MSIIGKNIIQEFGDPPQRVLHNLNFEIQDGEFVSISGRSGSGKSTLLYIISTLDKASSGDIILDGRNTKSMSSQDIHLFRNKHVGFIFQFHYLLEELSALENVLLPARNLGLINQKKDYAMQLLQKFGVLHKVDSYPKQMSGGEQQRVAIARALLMQPRYIFADEPTGNLDTENAILVMETLMEVNKLHNTTICLVTHEPDFSKMANREILLRDGKIVEKRTELSL